MALSLEKIQKLREQTAASMNDVKRALDEAKGDEQAALIVLRKQGKALADKKSSRATGAGIIASYVHGDGRMGVLLELRCETDFVAKTAEFQSLAHDLALHIAAAKPKYTRPEDVPQGVLEAEKEIYLSQVAALKKPENVALEIIKGKVQKYYDDVCLLNQRFVKDDSKTIKEVVAETVVKVGENIEVGKFVRFEI
ncbi:elongation factor Ts [Candidatus Azambacteria bacterium RIFCSPHIGHO2_02_FULL_52_12]|uniref:Elongation factor Ts n=1 Tax=Candidatus Azambacteria bacterium RIFCSPLOWO2_01_FULL_46_25 TaxID=1797298 RepID=A0A1F5BTN8_9BACT|nr:MAG: elongation factor Ts [Candidatus Azambacteria bacterium RIFCSPHIGHO2_02_FULL_52_12]OGD33968.1 MAG: elongation factor Ts [Candidatus Azambacteria bacterium RIFCSPLOWO2_01_FULL_46_25]OGD37654.1 MAG: elongation factor Ts [Candidatus Azambacteria bacterium RIFCSPHIGHO2_01_FULL_51_74]